jgi:cytochrome P450
VRATVLFVCTNPRIYTKLQAELDKADAEHRLTHPIITDAEAQTLPYLQACIKEGLRMWPPVLGLMQKTVPPSGDHLRDHFVPGGTNIGYCAWGLHRNVDIFGDDATIFRPERWLETDGEFLAEMNRTLDLVFGAGRYACLGKAIALIELGKTFAEVRLTEFVRRGVGTVLADLFRFLKPAISSLRHHAGRSVSPVEKPQQKRAVPPRGYVCPHIEPCPEIIRCNLLCLSKYIRAP